MNPAAQKQEQKNFNGCSLSLQLNGLKVLTIDQEEDIKAVLSFVAQKERKKKEATRWES